MTKKNPRRVYDSSGHPFDVMGFTKSKEGVTSGFRLRAADLRGEKEIALSEFKFYTTKRRKK